MTKILKALVVFFASQIAFITTSAHSEPTTEELKLYNSLNQYRASNGLPSIPLSPSLTHVAQTHVRDLHKNPPNMLCNMHSWSDNEKWSGCCYMFFNPQAECMWNKPRELTGYPGIGYENAHRADEGQKASADSALNGLKNSSAHNAVMLNEGVWKDKQWNAVGVGIYENYAAIWFGEEEDPAQ